MDNDRLISGMNRLARDMLGLTSASPVGHCSELLALDPRELLDAAGRHRGEIEAPLWSVLRLQVLAQTHAAQAGTRRGTHAVPLKDHETTLIRKAVEDARGNVDEAAGALGISRATVYRRLQTRKR